MKNEPKSPPIHPKYNMNIFPDVFKIMVTGKERSGKDIFILKNIYDYINTGKFTIHPYLIIENLDNYQEHYRTIYYNGKLNNNYFKQYIELKEEKQFDKIYCSNIWISDADTWFNSRLTFKGGDKEQQIMQKIANMGKNFNFCWYSIKRPKNIDVKIRTLCNLKVDVKKLCINRKERDKIRSWIIYYKIYDENDKKIGENFINNLYEFCWLFDTKEIIRELIKN